MIKVKSLGPSRGGRTDLSRKYHFFVMCKCEAVNRVDFGHTHLFPSPAPSPQLLTRQIWAGFTLVFKVHLTKEETETTKKKPPPKTHFSKIKLSIAQPRISFSQKPSYI